MKRTKLPVLLFAAALLGGCAGMSNQSGTGASAAGSSSAASSDAEIVSKTKAALASDPDLKDVKIDVSSTQGAVRLKGEIKSMALRKKVDALVNGVKGVKSVDNQLIITG